jgi:hypothetical protein
MISILCLLGIVIANSMNMSHRQEEEWIANQWKWRWFLLEGLLNILYFVVFVSIAYLWRPTTNNSRYGLEQLPEEDYEDAIALRENGLTPRISKYEDLERLDEYEETAEEILKWAEENVNDVDDVPK